MVSVKGVRSHKLSARVSSAKGEGDISKLEKFLKEILEHKEKETKEKAGERYWSILKHLDAFDLFWPTKDDLVTLFKMDFSEMNNSLVFLRFGEIQFHLIISHIAVTIGAYHLILRELRYILDGIVHAYYLDTNHPKLNLETKVDILARAENERKLYGTTLIDKTRIENKQTIKNIYSELCKYVHSSSTELKDIIKKQHPWLHEFNKELFKKCLEFTNKTMDVVFLLFIKKFSQVIPKIKKVKHSLIEYSLLTEFLSKEKS